VNYQLYHRLSKKCRNLGKGKNVAKETVNTKRTKEKCNKLWKAKGMDQEAKKFRKYKMKHKEKKNIRREKK